MHASAFMQIIAPHTGWQSVRQIKLISNICWTGNLALSIVALRLSLAFQGKCGVGVY